MAAIPASIRFDPENVRRLIESEHCQWVFFDYFDTIVKRTIVPEHTKRLACSRIAQLAGYGVSGDELYLQRARIERELCVDNEARGLDLEFELRTALARLWVACPGLQSIPEAVFVELAVAIEIGVECSVQQPHADLIEILDAIPSGTRCAIVSDFYLASADFEKMLVHHGIAGHFDRLFVSADYLQGKRSGRIFPHVLAACGVSGQQAVFIGDNRVSDYERPIEAGIPAVHVDASAQHQAYRDMEAVEPDDPEKLEARLDAALSALPPTPFGDLAFALHLFVERLHAALLRAGQQDVFFLAREGQFLQRLFDEYQQRRRLEGIANIRSHYLEVSRQSTFLPSLDRIGQESFERLFRQYRRISLREFVASLGLEEFIPSFGVELDFERRHEDLKPSDDLAKLLASPGFGRIYERERVQRESALVAYLAQFPMEARQTTLALVDVGWKGTIQDNLVQTVVRNKAQLGHDQVDGYYLGLVAAGAASEMNRKSGLVLSAIPENGRYFDIFNENRALFEVMLAADHGSCRSYVVDSHSKAAPVRSNFDESELYFSKVAPVQAAIGRRFSAIDSILALARYDTDWIERLCAQRHARMVFSAPESDQHWFEDVSHVENFGVFEVSRFDHAFADPGLLAKLKFFVQLYRNTLPPYLGFWPWLTCRRRGGRLSAWWYRRRQVRELERAG